MPVFDINQQHDQITGNDFSTYVLGTPAEREAMLHEYTPRVMFHVERARGIFEHAYATQAGARFIMPAQAKAGIQTLDEQRQGLIIARTTAGQAWSVAIEYAMTYLASADVLHQPADGGNHAN